MTQLPLTQEQANQEALSEHSARQIHQLRPFGYDPPGGLIWFVVGAFFLWGLGWELWQVIKDIGWWPVAGLGLVYFVWSMWARRLSRDKRSPTIATTKRS